MENREEVQTGRSIIGAARDKDAMSTKQDPWGEAPFFGADSEASENVTNIVEGDAVCAVYHGIRIAKNQYKSLYLVMETEDGEKLRLFAPRHLAGQFADLEALEKRNTTIPRIEVGTYVEVTYRGLKENPNGGKDYKHFDVLVPKEQLN